MKREIILIITLLILLFAANFVLAAKCKTDQDCPKSEICQNGKCVSGRALEIVYPDIPGIPTPKLVSFGLPDYINYIFSFSIVFFGFLILGVLIYNGINYLTSFGNPTRLTDAKQGMLAALLGSIILFGAFIIFNTINPQLVIMEPSAIPPLKPYITPGVYFCNYRVGDIGQVLEKYREPIPSDIKDPGYENAVNTRIEAVKRFNEIVGKPDKPDRICFLAAASTPFKSNFKVRPDVEYKGDQIIEKTPTQTIFIVPEENPKGTPAWEFNYGVVLHEKDNFTGKCKVLPTPKTDGSIYNQIVGFRPTIDFTAETITLFRKSYPGTYTQEALNAAEGVILYEGWGFNEVGWEEEEEGEGKKANGAKCMEDEECESNNCVIANPNRPDLGGHCRAKSGGFLPSSLFAGLSKVLAAEDPNLLKVPFPPGGADVKIVDQEFHTAMTVGGKTKYLNHNVRSITIEPENGFIAVLLGDESSVYQGGQKKGTVGERNEKCEVRKVDDSNLMNDSIGRCGQCGWYHAWWNPFRLPGGKCYPCLEYMIVIKGQAL